MRRYFLESGQNNTLSTPYYLLKILYLNTYLIIYITIICNHHIPETAARFLPFGGLLVVYSTRMLPVPIVPNSLFTFTHMGGVYEVLKIWRGGKGVILPLFWKVSVGFLFLFFKYIFSPFVLDYFFKKWFSLCVDFFWNWGRIWRFWRRTIF